MGLWRAAVIGGAVGAIGGAFAGLLGAAFDARDARTKIKEAISNNAYENLINLFKNHVEGYKP